MKQCKVGERKFVVILESCIAGERGTSCSDSALCAFAGVHVVGGLFTARYGRARVPVFAHSRQLRTACTHACLRNSTRGQARTLNVRRVYLPTVV